MRTSMNMFYFSFILCCSSRFRLCQKPNNRSRPMTNAGSARSTGVKHEQKAHWYEYEYLFSESDTTQRSEMYIGIT